MAENEKPANRDGRGRFTKGNSGGAGGSRSRAFTFRKAAEEAITIEHIGAMIRKAARMGLEGNLGAMRFVFERVSGRVADAPIEAEPIAIELPPLQSANACNQAIERLIAGICEGTVDGDSAKLIITAIQVRLRAIEVTEIEERLTELEETANTVDHGGSRRRKRS